MDQEHDWLRPGMAIVTTDGETLGTVKELSKASFKVDAPMAMDYWLPFEAVVQTTVAEEQAITTFRRDELADHIVPSPDDTLLV